MFRISDDPSSGSLVDYLAKIKRMVLWCSLYRKALPIQWTRHTHTHTHTHAHTQRVRICCHNTDHVHVNGHDRTILVILALMIDPLWSETCWSTFKYFIILILSTNYIFVQKLDNEVFIPSGMFMSSCCLLISEKISAILVIEAVFMRQVFERALWMQADDSGRAFSGVGLRPLACWDGGFESRRRNGCLSLVSVVYDKVEVSSSGWSLVQRSPTECGVCTWVSSWNLDNEETLTR